jgi:membrane-associated phospholipid phosphatase
VRRRAHWAGELLVVLGLLVIYDFVAGQSRAEPAEAYAHGRSLLGLSPWGIEKAADHWLAGVGWLQDPSSYYYDLAHVDVTMAVLLGCWIWRAQVYRQARNALVLINVVGLVVFFLYPVAPPRLLPGGGFVDIVANSGTWGAANGAVQHPNEYGSMPSLHTAWALWVALTVMAMTPRPRWRVLGWLHVAVTVVVVVITGNHYLVDIVAGAATAAVAWVISQRVPRVPAAATERTRTMVGS